MSQSINSKTRVLTLLGDPVSHSLSPIIQNAACAAAGVDGVYVAMRCDRERLPALMESIAEGGGGGNVTLPHKERAAAVVKLPSEAVRRTGACNTFWSEGGKIRGDNTDVEGFRRALERFLGRPPRDHRVLVLGAGGAARAVLLALLDEGVKDVTLHNRTVERARAVSRRIGGERVRVVVSGGRVRVHHGPDVVAEHVEHAGRHARVTDRAHLVGVNGGPRPAESEAARPDTGAAASARRVRGRRRWGVSDGRRGP